MPTGQHRESATILAFPTARAQARGQIQQQNAGIATHARGPVVDEAWYHAAAVEEERDSRH